MKTTTILATLILLSSCGGIEGEEIKNNIEPTSIKLKFPSIPKASVAPTSKMTWNVTSYNCSKSPSFNLFLEGMFQELMPQFNNFVPTQKEVFTIDCVSNVPVCYGAWLSKDNFYNCSSNPCSFISHQEEYLFWGCGKGCTNEQALYQYACHTCMEREVNVVLNCGGS